MLAVSVARSVKCGREVVRNYVRVLRIIHVTTFCHGDERDLFPDKANDAARNVGVRACRLNFRVLAYVLFASGKWSGFNCGQLSVAVVRKRTDLRVNAIRLGSYEGRLFVLCGICNLGEFQRLNCGVGMLVIHPSPNSTRAYCFINNDLFGFDLVGVFIVGRVDRVCGGEYFFTKEGHVTIRANIYHCHRFDFCSFFFRGGQVVSNEDVFIFVKGDH